MNKLNIKRELLILTFIIIFFGCSGPVQKIYISNTDIPLYEKPKDWETEREKTIVKYSDHLAGRKIFIDPGHGGSDRRNKSISGKVIEADVNLAVSLYLKEYLERAGAIVFMSRTDDRTVELLDRPKMANESGAEIFISIHHNSPGSPENNWTNYTSTFYHSMQGREDYIPSAHNLAKFVQRDLAYIMRNSGGLGSFDGTYSDFIIYPEKGFAVLRETDIPAILVECSFFTNRTEELRLQIDEFNQIQAWGIFRGIGKYYLNGVPEIILLHNRSKLSSGTLTLIFELKDRFEIDEESIKVKFNDVRMIYDYSAVTKTLSFGLSNIDPGEYVVEAECKNINGNFSFPFKKTIKIN